MVKLLPNRESFEGQGIPLVLEGREEGRDGCECRRSGCNYSGGFEIDEIGDFQFFPIYRILMVLLDITLDQALLVDVAYAN